MFEEVYFIPGSESTAESSGLHAPNCGEADFARTVYNAAG